MKRIVGDRNNGRGVEENGQGLIASLFAAKAMMDECIRPSRDVKLFMVADEEVGSAKGMVFLAKEHPEIFGRDDLYLVPDAGDPDGAMIEVSEKSIMWLKVRTLGKQVHASTPAKGLNANLAAMRFLTTIYEELHARYPQRDDLFDHPVSSFEPTKREGNVPNVNTIPGEDVSYLDCRVMPGYDPFEVLEFIRARATDFGSKNGVTIEISPVQMERAAPPTSPDHPLVGILEKAVMDVYHVEAHPVGIGGGTCAAILRRAGYPSVVWARLEETAHMPNESALISNYIGDARVFLRLYLS
jgi:succinyl-diaminopimelate desuccinylase